ncbi:MAG TPA: protein kinase [Thermoanaerobaculia bacterium]|nr:protein kinase [Thermoanaerobaculia bacterium]
MQNELVSHFRVLERIGEGGMGAVYRAEDTHLGREVALKFLPRSATRDARARERFLREARAASALDHPNVCTIYEAGETDDGTVFLAMAYYRGETLGDRLQRGPLSAAETLRVGAQLAAALAQAHGRGIIHRDVKPSNVFLTEDGLVKLLDFGLAHLAASSRLTRSGTVVGTAGYMSPEQALGDGVDHRADLWSLGVLLYEALTGRLPFGAGSEVSMLYAIVHREPAELRQTRAGLPEGLYAILERCLVKDPEQRYRSAEMLRQDLERVERSLGSADQERTESFLTPLAAHRAGAGGVAGGLIGSVRTRLRRAPRGALWAAAAALLLGLATGGWLMVREGVAVAGTADTPRSLAVLPLVNATGDPGMDAVAAGLGAVLLDQLAGVAGINVVSRDEAWSIRHRRPQASVRDVARELGVEAVLEGQLLARNDMLQAHLSLVDAATGFVRWSSMVQEKGDRLVELQERMGREVARDLLGSLARQPDHAVDAPTASEEAYRLYLEAEGRLDHMEETGEMANVEEMLRRAISLDPRFALAHARLSQVLTRRALREGSGVLPEAQRHARRSLELAPELPEAQLADADVRRRQGDHAGAIDTLRSLAALHPELDRVHSLLAEAYRDSGDLAEAERTIRRALQARPDYWRYWHALGELLVRQGDAAGAREVLTRAASLTELDYGRPYELLATLELVEGNFDAALAAFERLPRPIEDPLMASNIGTTYYFLGDLEEAERHYRLALRLAPSAAYHANLGDVLARQGKVDAARREYSRAADMMTARSAEGALPFLTQVNHAMYLAKAARCEEARRLAAQLLQRFDDTASTVATLAKAHAACGDTQEALDLLERALELGYKPQLAAGEVEFENLASEARFQRLVDPAPPS